MSGHVAPHGAAYSTVLVAHVLAAVVAVAAASASVVYALAAGRGPKAPSARSVTRFFRPGPNLAGRALWAVPLLGGALLAMSRGAYDLEDGFVLWGLGLWAAALAVGEGLWWPSERRLKAEVAGSWGAGDPGRLRRLVAAVAASAAAVCALVLAAMVVMVTKP